MMLFVLLSEDTSTVYITTVHLYCDLYRCYLFRMFPLNSGYLSCSLDGLTKQNTLGIFCICSPSIHKFPFLEENINISTKIMLPFTNVNIHYQQLQLRS